MELRRFGSPLGQEKKCCLCNFSVFDFKINNSSWILSVMAFLATSAEALADLSSSMSEDSSIGSPKLNVTFFPVFKIYGGSFGNTSSIPMCQIGITTGVTCSSKFNILVVILAKIVNKNTKKNMQIRQS